MNREKYLLFCIFPLFIGGLYYLFFKSNTLLENIIVGQLNIIPITFDLPILSSDLLKYYLCDYLWAFSLQCGLCVIFLPKNTKHHIGISITVIGLGIIWEISQYTGITNGTSDFADILAYVLGSISTLLLKNSKGDYE